MSDGNQFFWRAYASTIKKLMNSRSVDEHTRIYIAPANSTGVPAGKAILQECTNLSIYENVDFLLDPTNPNLATSKVARYSEALSQTLPTLKPGPGGETIAGLWEKLNSAQEKLESNRKTMNEAKRNAMEFYQEDPSFDKPKAFADWAPRNAMEYTNAYNYWQNAFNEVVHCIMCSRGAGSSELANAIQTVANVNNTLYEMLGSNTKASIKPVTYDASGSPIIPDPLETQFVPQYTMGHRYAALLDDWFAKSSQEASEYEINLSTGQESSFEDLGFTEEQGSDSFSKLPVFDFYSNGGVKVNHSNFDLIPYAGDVNVKIKINHYETLPLYYGQLHLDIKKLLGTLKAESPAMFQNVRPTQVLVAQGVSMEISFSEDAKDAFGEEYVKTVEDGGGISIFGFHIGTTDASEGTTTHGHSWDPSSGVLTIEPENLRSTAKVLAVVGEVLSS